MKISLKFLTIFFLVECVFAAVLFLRDRKEVTNHHNPTQPTNRYEACLADVAEYQHKRLESIPEYFKSLVSEYVVVADFDQPPVKLKETLQNLLQQYEQYEKTGQYPKQDASKDWLLNWGTDEKQPLSNKAAIVFRDQTTGDCEKIEICSFNPSLPELYIQVEVGQPRKIYAFPVSRLDETDNGYTGQELISSVEEEIKIDKSTTEIKTKSKKSLLFKIQQLSADSLYIEWVNEGYRAERDQPFMQSLFLLLKRTPHSDLLEQGAFRADEAHSHCEKLFGSSSSLSQ